jgi:hypothetical protein
LKDKRLAETKEFGVLCQVLSMPALAVGRCGRNSESSQRGDVLDCAMNCIRLLRMERILLDTEKTELERLFINHPGYPALRPQALKRNKQFTDFRPPKYSCSEYSSSSMPEPASVSQPSEAPAFSLDLLFDADQTPDHLIDTLKDDPFLPLPSTFSGISCTDLIHPTDSPPQCIRTPVSCLPSPLETLPFSIDAFDLIVDTTATNSVHDTFDLLTAKDSTTPSCEFEHVHVDDLLLSDKLGRVSPVNRVHAELEDLGWPVF